MASASITSTSDDAEPFATLGRLTYAHATHAPLHERYMPSGNYEAVGEPGEYGPIDPQSITSS